MNKNSTRARWTARLAAVLLVCLVSEAVAQKGAADKQDKELAVELDLSAEKATFTVGEQITIRYSIKNRGQTTFYICGCSDWTGPEGGFEIKVAPPDNAQVVAYGHGLVAITPETRRTMDLVEDPARPRILMTPGTFCGREAPAPFRPLSAGTYRIFVVYHGPGLTELEMQSLRDLKHPLLLGTYSSPSIEITVKAASEP